MTLAPPVIIERLTRVAPLGLRFWDSVSGAAVGEGLIVTAYPSNNPARRVQAIPNRSGVFVFQGMPGLREVENGKGDTDFWERPLPRRSFAVEVYDSQHRFQPFRFSADLPVHLQFSWACPSVASPLASLALLAVPVPLFSSITRSAPAGMAILHADLQEAASGNPAAWAVLEARWKGKLLARGLADEKGRIILIFPYPEPQDAGATSPPTRIPLAGQSWRLDLAALYSPVMPVPQMPDLCQALGQSSVSLWDSLSPNTPLPQVEIKFGREMIVKSQSKSSLLIG